MFVFVVVIDVVAKMDVVGVPNCGTVVVDVPNCGTVVVVDAPNAGIALLLIVLKPFVLLAVVVGIIDVGLEAVEAPKRNRGLLVDEVDIVEVIDVVPSENIDALGSPNVDAVDAVAVVFAVNELFATVEVLDVKVKGLVVTCVNDVASLFAGLPKVVIFVWILLLGGPNIKLSDFGVDCKVVLLLPKANKGAIADVVVLPVLLFTTLLKAEMLVVVVVLTGNSVPEDWDGKLETAT